VFPWLIFAVVAVPLVLVAFVATRRRTAAREQPTGDEALTLRELSEAEAYDAKWHEEDKERYRQERLP
jgi:hypothetical protein